MHECSTCRYSLMKVAVCYQNVGEQLSILASVYESFIMSDLLSHSGLFQIYNMCLPIHKQYDRVTWSKY